MLALPMLEAFAPRSAFAAPVAPPNGLARRHRAVRHNGRTRGRVLCARHASACAGVAQILWMPEVASWLIQPASDSDVDAPRRESRIVSIVFIVV